METTKVMYGGLIAKHWYASKAMWGGIIAAVGAVGDMFMQGGPTVGNLTALGGALFAIYGRYVATAQIKGVGTSS
jgi:hypothetical protein